MRFDDLDMRQREHERYHGLRVPKDQWIIARVDGRAFTALTNTHFTKPFDSRFGEIMTAAATALLTEFGGQYVYTQSDEISLLLPRQTELFGRSVEKLVSLTAATASVAFTEAYGHRAAFDARLWTGDGVEDVVDYFAWRQADAARNALSTCVYWALIEQGLSARRAHGRLTGLGRAAKQDLLATCGVPFDERPSWQRRGTGIWHETVEKQAYDPKAQQHVTALRRRLRHESELPEGAAYRDLVRDLATRSARPASAAATATAATADATATATTPARPTSATTV